MTSAQRRRPAQPACPTSSPSDRANLNSLLVCAFSILSICLTAFNVYLLVWVCSALTGSESMSGARPSLLDQLELFREDSKRIKLSGRLTAEKPLLARRVGQDHLASAKSVLRMTSAAEIVFAADNSSSFSMSAPRNSLEFPTGLRVFGRAGDKSAMIDCSDGEAAEPAACRLQARHLRLTNLGGVDFSNVSAVQTGRVRTRRLHSPLQKLQLMSGSGASVESLDEEIQLQALDLVSLGRRHSAESTVIIRAKSINVAALRRAEGAPEASGNRFKLCVCLAGPGGDDGGARGGGAANEWPNNGRVFAVGNKLRCSKFSERFCAPNKRNINN